MEKDDFRYAVIQEVKQYWAGKEPGETGKVSPNRKYTKKYFDAMSPDKGKEEKEKYENAE